MNQQNKQERYYNYRTDIDVYNNPNPFFPKLDWVPYPAMLCPPPPGIGPVRWHERWRWCMIERSQTSSLDQTCDNPELYSIQGDQLNMALFYWYLVKIQLSSVHVYSSLHRTSHILKVPEKHGHFLLVNIYVFSSSTHILKCAN